MRYQTVKAFVQNTSGQQAIGFGLLVALLVLNASVSYLAIGDLVRKENNVQRTLNFLVALKDTFSALQDAETGQRGYLLSGEEKHLEPYENALANMQGHLTILTTLRSELPRQQNSIEQLIDLIGRKTGEMERVVALSRSDLNQAAFSLERSDTGYALMREIRELVAEMEQREYTRMSQQRNAASQSRQQVTFTIAVATFTSLLLIGAVYILIQRAIRKQQEDAEKLALTNEELEAIVSERTLEIERYSEELRRSNRELQDFAFVASHDLQEPLRKIRAFGDRLKDKFSGEQIGADGLDYIGRMQAAAERMSLLINDLLEFSRVSTRPGDFETISLQSALDDVLDNLSESADTKGACIERGPLPNIDADPTQMRQLLQNLLSNSLKFTAEGERPHIRVNAETFVNGTDSDSRQWCRITVSDNGIGFDQRYAERIFTPFQRLHGRGEYSGSGIGLAVCRRVVERHGGSIAVSSSPGQGTRFTIELPLQQQVEMKAAPELTP
ncbi:sensor histidine kinase [Gilvimarinus sp. F26214L]|uniref:sensor histidine kinase n=1 Tax=Gilvimarinus sp. DZF01 TaxID=3461371 RepID=UPI00404557A1